MGEREYITKSRVDFAGTPATKVPTPWIFQQSDILCEGPLIKGGHFKRGLRYSLSLSVYTAIRNSGRDIASGLIELLGNWKKGNAFGEEI